MQNTVYYFSGTGNSLQVAKLIADKLENTEILSIAGLLNEKVIENHSECIGIVFPVYCVDVPDFIQDFIKKISLNNQQYVFTVVTCGGTPGNSLYTVDKLLIQLNNKLSYGYEVLLGDNSIVYKTGIEELNKRIKDMELICETIVMNTRERVVSNQIYGESVESTKLKHDLQGLLYEELQINNKSTNHETCTLCRKCISICPTKNISIDKNNITWGTKCVQCFACLNMCPNASIQFGKIAPTKEQQYHFPLIS